MDGCRLKPARPMDVNYVASSSSKVFITRRDMHAVEMKKRWGERRLRATKWRPTEVVSKDELSGNKLPTDLALIIDTQIMYNRERHLVLNVS